MYEVAKHFYSHFLPEVERILGPSKAKPFLEKHVLSDPPPLVQEGMSKEELERLNKFYDQRYGGEEVE